MRRLIAQQTESNNARRESLRLDAMIAASRQGNLLGNNVCNGVCSCLNILVVSVKFLYY